jgi:predicted amidophosphoribosyltransferase
MINVADAFELVEGYDEFKKFNVILVDDVATTLATLQECAKVLKNAGYNRIDAVVLARAG